MYKQEGEKTQEWSAGFFQGKEQRSYLHPQNWRGGETRYHASGIPFSGPCKH